MEVLSGVHRVDGTRMANVYLVLGERIAVIDTGAPGDGQKTLRYIGGLNRKPSDVSIIILTHYHFDHCGGLGVVKRETGAQVVAHELESAYISGEKPNPQQGLLFKMGGWLFRFEHVGVDRVVRDQDRLEEHGLRIIHTPGHTPGSISILMEDRRVMFTGDTIGFSDGRMLGPAKRWSLDAEEAWRSVRKLSQFEFDVMLGGHGEPLMENASTKIRKWVGARELPESV